MATGFSMRVLAEHEEEREEGGAGERGGGVGVGREEGEGGREE